MESLSNERREAALVRMPVTMSVELAHEGFSEVFEADALNVSAGGLGMRAAMLPDVGQRMTCRFAMPDLDAPCEADGEVVWASDAGADAGEFGIRFDTLEPRVGEALARWVASLEAVESAPAPKKSRGVRVQLDGVASPIDAEIAVKTATMVRVEQPLPFLKLGTGAMALGERRVLRAVELRVEADVPRLVLELGTLAGASSESTASDAPLDDLAGPAMPVMEERIVVARTKPRVLDDEPMPDEAPEEAPSSGDDLLAANDDSGDALEAPIVREPASPMPKKARRDDEARAVRLPSEREVSVESLVASAQLADPEDTPSFGERVTQLREAAAPALGRALSAMRSGWVALVTTAGPRAAALGGAIVRAFRALMDAVRERAPGIVGRFRRAPKRRTTTAPPVSTREPTASRKQGAKDAPAPAPQPRLSPRLVVAGVLGLAAIGIVVNAMASGAPEADVVPVHAVSTAPAPLETAVEEELVSEPAAVVESPEVEAAPAAPELPEVSAADVERALGGMPAPTTEAGRIPAPTFPSVGEGATAEASAEPAAEPVVDDDGDLHFGATDVPHGRPTTFRMSLPVTALEGESDASGFTVTLHGALSLDPARRIAAANPSVERAAILNHGDHSILMVRFVEGRTPAYSVEASGSTVTVTIGR